MNQPQDPSEPPAEPGAGFSQPGPLPPGYGSPSGQVFEPGYGQQYTPYGYGVQPAGKDPALAEWWRRLLARVIDGIIIGVFFVPLWIPPWHTYIGKYNQIAGSYPAGTPLSNIPAANDAIARAFLHLLGSLVLIGLLACLVTFAYDWIQHAIWGQTIGKRALGTKVVTADTRAKVPAGSACGRAAVYALIPVVPVVGSFFALLNELWLTWDRRSQCLHDKAAHTVVIKKRYSGSQPPQAPTW
jgi:uncharacterized RDD family membrane protein YckC